VTQGALATRIVAATTATLIAGGAAVAVTAGMWGSTLREEARLLPGTVLAGVDVGGATHDDARDLATTALASALDRPVVLSHEDATWQVTPRDLDADTDLDERIATALTATDDATLPQLVRLRWASPDERPLEVGISVPAERIAAFVDDIADQLDLAPTDATLAWVDAAPITTEDADGLLVDRDATVDALTLALDETPDEPLPVATEPLRPEVTTSMAEAAREATSAAIDEALDHVVTVRHPDRTWSLTPRDLDASPVGEPLVTAALTAALRTTLGTGDAEPLEVELSISDDAVDGFVAELAGALDVAPVHAEMTYRDGEIRTTEPRNGRSLDRAGTRTALRSALQGDHEVVELELGTVRARTVSDVVDVGDLDDVLVVRQGRRVVELHRGGTLIRSWPVAVGTGGSPTPTGTFSVGAKRFEPTWNNPALDRWGKDMPARIGPGPDNPLGARALNWNRPGGGDTLIRFHGTPNEESIGTASSNGCVRMFDADVIEMYDLVPSGATILSVA
jgi:lipoprotein-anchoring transpeptidase ErfK/SrfK